MTSYLADALTWSIVGFICGYCFARVRSHEARSGFLERVEPVKKNETEKHVSLWQHPIALFMVVLSLFTVAQGAWFSWDNQRRAHCQAMINEELREVAKEERKDYFETWRKILESTSRENSRKIFQDHLDRGERREREREVAQKKENC